MDLSLLAAIDSSAGRPYAYLYKPGLTTLPLTHTRADATTCARYRDANGIWQVVAANVLRDAHYHYDATAGQSYRTMLREGAGTNSALGSCSWADATYWSNAASAFTLAAATSCISGQAATKHTNTSVGSNARTQTIGTFVNGQADCVSAIVEQGTAPTSRLDIRDTTAAALVGGVLFTWATLTASSSGGSPTAYGAIPLGATGPNGGALYRIWVTTTGAAAGTGGAGNSRAVYWYITGVAADTTYAYVHHAQLEAASSYPSSPIVTVAGAVTRAADVISVPWTRNPEAGTWYLDCYDLGGSLGRGIPFYLGHLSGASNRGVGIGTNAASAPFITEWDGSTQVQSGVLTGPSYGQRAEYRPVIASTGVVKFGLSKDSAVESVSTSSGALALPTGYVPAQLTIGSYYTAANQYNCAIRSICYIPGPETSLASFRVHAGS